MNCANNCHQGRDCDCAEYDHPAWFKIVIITVFVGFAALIGLGIMDQHDAQVTHITDTQK